VAALPPVDQVRSDSPPFSIRFTAFSIRFIAFSIRFTAFSIRFIAFSIRLTSFSIPFISQPSGVARAPHADAAPDALAPTYTCGGCGEQQSTPMAHECARRECRKALHSYITCVHVFMPDEGKYFCDADCIRGYNLVHQGDDRVPCMYRTDVVCAPLPRPFAARAATIPVVYDTISAAALGFLSDPIIPTDDLPIDACFKCTFALFQSNLDDESAKLVDGRPCCESETDCKRHLRKVEAAAKRTTKKPRR